MMLTRPDFEWSRPVRAMVSWKAHTLSKGRIYYWALINCCHVGIWCIHFFRAQSAWSPFRIPVKHLNASHLNTNLNADLNASLIWPWCTSHCVLLYLQVTESFLRGDRGEVAFQRSEITSPSNISLSLQKLRLRDGKNLKITHPLFFRSQKLLSPPRWPSCAPPPCTPWA